MALGLLKMTRCTVLGIANGFRSHEERGTAGIVAGEWAKSICVSSLRGQCAGATERPLALKTSIYGAGFFEVALDADVQCCPRMWHREAGAKMQIDLFPNAGFCETRYFFPFCLGA